MIRVELYDSQDRLRYDAARLRDAVAAVLSSEGVSRADVSIALIDDRRIEDLNRRYLDHDGPTDVISFPLSEPEEPELLGQLAISTETAAREADRLGVDPRDELLLYAVHGTLHLLGYDDQSDADRARMRRLERRHLEALGRPRPRFDGEAEQPAVNPSEGSSCPA